MAIKPRITRPSAPRPGELVVHGETEPLVVPDEKPVVASDGEAGKRAGDPFAALGAKPLVEQCEHVRLLVVGSTGSGKTRLAASSAKVEAMRSVLFLSFESGTMAIPRVDRPYIDVLEVTDAELLGNVLRALRGDQRHYATVIVDDGVEMVNVIKAGLLEQQVSNNPNHDAEILTLQDFNRLYERVINIMRFLRDGPWHLIVTAKTRDRGGAAGNSVIVPNMPPSIASTFPGMFDIVGWLRVFQPGGEEDPPLRRLELVGSAEASWPKDRTDETGLRKFVDNPDMATLLKNFLEHNKI